MAACLQPSRWLPAAALLAALADAQPPPHPPVEMGWVAYLTQSFYHQTVIPLLGATVFLAYLARPSTSDELPPGFRRFQISYLTVWSLCVAADWLQGPYVYALYAAYGFSGTEIAELFVAGFGSSMVFGSFVGTVIDKFGRKKCSMLYCVLYMVSCLTKHFKLYSVLMVGRVTGGVATSMLFSCFECWMVSEHQQRHSFSGSLLGYMFGLMFCVQYIVAIASGLAGQAVADSFTFAPIAEGSVIYTGGYCCPFDLAILTLCVGIVLIALFWEENYGSAGAGASESSGSLLENFQQAGQLLLSDRRTLLLCVVVSTFEGSMYAFVFNWTPALRSETTPPPHGVIFALFMMSCMCGASASTLLGNVAKPATRVTLAFGAGFSSFVLASFASTTGAEDKNLRLSLFAFLVFEFCVGIYFPSSGVLKSEVVPEQVRGTMYNMYRVPLNAIVVGLLLSNISMATCFKLNALLLLAGLVSVTAIGYFAPAISQPAKIKEMELGKAGYEQVAQVEAMSDDGKEGHATVLGRRRGKAEEDTMPA